MTLEEFSKLKVGDAIENVFTNSRGTVTEVLNQGVKVRWGPLENSHAFTYTIQSTTWMHWSLADVPKTA